MTEFLRINEMGSHLVISPESGGSIIRYFSEKNKKEIDWFKRDKAVNNCCFPLAPFCNRIRKGRFHFADKEYQLVPNETLSGHSLHGSAWQGRWQLVKKTRNSCIISYQEYARSRFPFSYKIEQAFSLAKDSLRIHLILTHTGTESFPFGLGLHPYFPCSAATILQVETDGVWLTDGFLMPLKRATNAYVRQLSQGMKPAAIRLDNSFYGWNRKAFIQWNNRQMELTATGPLDYLCIYSPGKSSFCVEPVSNVPDAFNLMAQGHSHHGSQILAAGETIEAMVCFHTYI